jgi:HEAT repeat protein
MKKNPLTCYGMIVLASIAAASVQVRAQNDPSRQASPVQAVSATNDTRRADLLRGLTAVSDSVRVRSLHELAESGVYDDAFCKALLRYAREANDFQSPPVIPIVAAGGARIVPSLLEMLRQTPSQDPAWNTLALSLGRMGPDAKEAVPELRRMMEDRRQEDEQQILLRTVLAAIGWTDADNEAKLSQWVRTRSKEGRSVVSILAVVGAQHWPGKDSVALLSPWFDGKPSEESAMAALALASLGTNAAPAAAEIQRCLAHVDEQWSTLRIIYGTALARILQPRSTAQKSAYRDMLSYLGEAGNHTDWAALSMVAHTLVDSNLFAQTITLLGDSKPAVAQGATRMLSELGKQSDVAGPKIIALLRKAKREDARREELARALGFVLSATKIRSLEQVLAAEKDEEVRESLENALLVVSLGSRVVGESAQAALGGATDKNLTAILRAFRSLDTDYQARQAIRRQGTNVVSKLVGAMGSADAELRAGAAQGFAALLLESVKLSAEQENACVRALTNALADTQPVARKEAAGTLLYFAIHGVGRDAALPALMKSLDDPPARQRAVDAIGYYGPGAKEAVPALTKLLTDQDMAVRKSAAEALGRIGPEARDSVDALLAALNSHESLQPAVTQALGEIGAKPDLVIPALVKLLATDNPYSGVTSSFSARAVARYGTNALPYLLPLLDSPEPKERFWTCVAFLRMAEMGNSANGALGALERLLNDPDQEVRRMATLAVKLIREPKRN